MTPIPLSIGEQAAALSRDWSAWLETSATARKRAAMLMRTSRAMTKPRSTLLVSVLEILATRPKHWWQASDIIEPLAALGWHQTATQIGHVLRRAHKRDQLRKKELDGGRRVLYRIGEGASC